MKEKLSRLISIFSILVLTIIMLPVKTSASALNTYALIVSDDAYLYRNNVLDDSLNNRYFMLPKNFFVQILEANVGMNIHRVRYKDIDGYVEADKVDIKDYTPKSIFPQTVTLQIRIEGPLVNLRERPDTSSRIVEEIPKDTKEIEYYNFTHGTVAGISGTNDVWYFISYQKSQDNSLKGYIYSDYIIKDSEIPLDNDTTALIPPIVDVPTPTPSEPDLNNADSFIKTLIIILITIPALLIAFFIFKPLPKRVNSDIEEKSL